MSRKGFDTESTRRNPNRIEVYIPPNKKSMVVSVREFLKRENSTLSKFVMEKIEEEYHLHEDGNPQQLLDFVSANGKPYVAPRKCGFKGCGGRAFGFGVHMKSGRRYALCKMHYQSASGTGSWRVE